MRVFTRYLTAPLDEAPASHAAVAASLGIPEREINSSRRGLRGATLVTTIDGRGYRLTPDGVVYAERWSTPPLPTWPPSRSSDSTGER